MGKSCNLQLTNTQSFGPRTQFAKIDSYCSPLQPDQAGSPSREQTEPAPTCSRRQANDLCAQRGLRKSVAASAAAATTTATARSSYGEEQWQWGSGSCSSQSPAAVSYLLLLLPCWRCCCSYFRCSVACAAGCNCLLKSVHSVHNEAT